jgi:hypothetical protein
MKQTHMIYGFVSGIAMISISLVMRLAGLKLDSPLQYLAYVPFLVGVIMAGMAFSKANDGFVSFGNVFGSCFKAAMIVTIIVVLWSVATVYLFPDLKDKAIEAAREKMLQDKKTTDEQIETILNVTRKYWTPIMIGGALLGTLFYGAIFSLIGAAAAKKNGPRPFTADNF